MNPTYLWMIDNEMVGKISGNLHIIREDLKSMRLEMKALQDNIEDKHLIDIAKKLSHKINKTVIQN